MSSLSVQHWLHQKIYLKYSQVEDLSRLLGFLSCRADDPVDRPFSLCN